MSCCRAKDQDPDLEYFDKLQILAYQLLNRSSDQLHKDVAKPMLTGKYKLLKEAIQRIEQVTGITL